MKHILKCASMITFTMSFGQIIKNICKAEVFLICHAIVLKNYFPKKNKVTILHEQYGKINFFVHEASQASRLCNGSLIYCDVQKKDTTYQCYFIDAYFIPLDQDRYDLYFIHDLLS